MSLPHSNEEGGAWRLKAVAKAEPDALARMFLLLEAHNLVPIGVTAHRASVRGRTTLVLEIEIALAATDLAADAFRHLVASIAELPTVLSTVVPDASSTAS